MSTRDAFDSCFGDSDDEDGGDLAGSVDKSSKPGKVVEVHAAPLDSAILHTPPVLPSQPVTTEREFQEGFPPLYFGPIGVAASECGGARCFVALQDIPPGTLVLAESAVIQWGNITNVELMVKVIEDVITKDDAGGTLMKAVRKLHPQALFHLPKDIVTPAMEACRGDAAKAQFLLAMQHNGFMSGLYFHMSMFNHSPTPNCYKMAIAETGVGEVWSTRDIKRGEELFLTYCVPQDMLQSSKVAAIEPQHHFVPPAPPVEAEALSEGVDSDMREACSLRIEECDEKLSDWEEAIESITLGVSKGLFDSATIAQQAVGIYGSALQCLESVEAWLADTHVTRRRFYALLAQTAELGDGFTAKVWAPSHTPVPPGTKVLSPSSYAAAAALRWNLKLLRSREACPWIGPLHPDTGAAAEGACSALQRLMARTSKAAVLQGFGTEENWTSTENVTAAERELRLRASRIQALYDSKRYGIDRVDS